MESAQAISADDGPMFSRSYSRLLQLSVVWWLERWSSILSGGDDFKEDLLDQLMILAKKNPAEFKCFCLYCRNANKLTKLPSVGDQPDNVSLARGRFEGFSPKTWPNSSSTQVNWGLNDIQTPGILASVRITSRTTSIHFGPT